MKLKIVFCLIVVGIGLVQCKLDETYRWTQVEYAWPNEQLKEQALASGSYKPDNNLPLGIEIWRNKFFVTVPR